MIKQKYYNRVLRIFLTAVVVFITAITIASIREVNAHNTAALYGDNTSYSDWNIFVMLSDMFSVTASAEECDVYVVEYFGEFYSYFATYESEEDIGSTDDDNYIIVDGKTVYIRDIVTAKGE